VPSLGDVSISLQVRIASRDLGGTNLLVKSPQARIAAGRFDTLDHPCIPHQVQVLSGRYSPTRARLCNPVPPNPAWQPSPLIPQWFLVQKKNPRGVCPPPRRPLSPTCCTTAPQDSLQRAV